MHISSIIKLCHVDLFIWCGHHACIYQMFFIIHKTLIYKNNYLQQYYSHVDFVDHLVNNLLFFTIKMHTLEVFPFILLVFKLATGFCPG